MAREAPGPRARGVARPLRWYPGRFRTDVDGRCGGLGCGPAPAGRQADARGQTDHGRGVRGHQGEDRFFVRRLIVLVLVALSACQKAPPPRTDWMIHSRLVFLAADLKTERPPLRDIGNEHWVACHFAEQLKLQGVPRLGDIPVSLPQQQPDPVATNGA